MTRRNDYAILIGINKYKCRDMFPDLQSPSADMRMFADWLHAQDGGDLPKENIRLIPATGSKFEDGKPQYTDFHNEFAEVIESYSPGNRIYLYFSGHGYSVKLSNDQRTALYAADASKYATYHISGTDYAAWTQSHAKFKEIVLVMDCCRDAEIVTPMLPPPLPNMQNETEAADTKLICIYGAPKGGKAQEREIPELNRVCSLLTHAFILALKHAPSDAQGRITGKSVKNYIEDIWNDICGDYPADPPEIYLPPRDDIVFRTGGSKPINQIFEINDWEISDRLTVSDQNNKLVCLIKFQCQSKSILVTWPARTESIPIANNRFSIPLPVGLYQAVLGKRQQTLTRIFQSGGQYVRF